MAGEQPMTDLATRQAIANAMETGSQLSRSLLFSLERQYLDVPLERATFLQPVLQLAPTSDPCFYRLEYVGDTPLGGPEQPFMALKTALAACHNPGRYTLLFLAASDGKRNQVYFGARSQDEMAYPPELFLEALSSFLRSNWPGTRLVPCLPDDPELAHFVRDPLQTTLHSAVALTGVPNLRNAELAGYPQSLDRLQRGLRGRPYLYLVVAEPLAQGDVDAALYRSREMLGQVHSLVRLSATDTGTVTQSESTTTTTGQSRSTGGSQGETRGSTRQVEPNTELISDALLAATVGLAAIFPPAALVTALGLAVATFWPSMTTTTSVQNTKTITWTDTVSSSEAVTKGLSVSAAQALGREHINTHAQAAECQLQRYIGRLEQARRSGCWNVGAYLLATNPLDSYQGGTQLKALLAGDEADCELIRVHDLKHVWARGARRALQQLSQPAVVLVDPSRPSREGVPPTRVIHPLGVAFSGLTTPLATAELALLVNLPRREEPGVGLLATAPFSLNPPAVEAGQDVILGRLLDGGEPTELEYRLALKSLAKHTLVAGVTGSGKTTTCKRLLRELHRTGVPFLVIEPAKDEYLSWALDINRQIGSNQPKGMAKIAVYMPGTTEHEGQTLAQLALNPLDLVWLDADHPPKALAHIDRLKSILNGVFPMQEALPILLEDVLYFAYRQPLNWLAETLPGFDTPRPTLANVLDLIRPVVKAKGYEERVAANLQAALTTRIESLRRGWKQQLFSAAISTPWPQIFDRPAVINLTNLGDDADKAFAMSIILLFLHEYRQAQHELGRRLNLPLHHVTVVEEAHRILQRASAGGLEQANPQAKVAEMFSNVLSEIRAYGEGFIIVDQVPARLVPDAIKNTNLKISHRLVAEDDRLTMSGCMTLTPAQAGMINRLKPGQAILYGDLDDSAAWVQVTG